MKCYHCGKHVDAPKDMPDNSVALCLPCAESARVKCHDCGAPIIAANNVTIEHPDVNEGEPFTLCGPCAVAKAEVASKLPDLTDDQREFIDSIKNMVE